MTDEAAAELVKRTRAAQGLPDKVEDPSVLLAIAQLISPPPPDPLATRRRALEDEERLAQDEEPPSHVG